MTIDLNSLTVVIPTWNTADLTIRCVARARGGRRAARADRRRRQRLDGRQRRAACSASLPGCRLIRFEENIGYGARHATPAPRSSRATAYLLSTATRSSTTPGSVARAARARSTTRASASLSPRLPERGPDAAAERRAGALARCRRSSGRPGSAASSRTAGSRSSDTHWDHATDARRRRRRTAPSMLVRGETWDELGGFDERIYMYAEEIDLCWRARRPRLAGLVHARSRVRAPRQRLDRRASWSDPTRERADRRVRGDGHPLAPAARVGRRSRSASSRRGSRPARRLQLLAATGGRRGVPGVRCAAI